MRIKAHIDLRRLRSDLVSAHWTLRTLAGRAQLCDAATLSAEFTGIARVAAAHAAVAAAFASDIFAACAAR